MKFTIVLLVLFSFSACRQNPSKEKVETLELILLGFRQDFDTTNPTKFGAHKYFKYDGSDTLIVKSCTYLDETTGEPILPVDCKYYAKGITYTQKSQLNFFIQYIKPMVTGELIKIRPKETYCDVFGGWIVIYTDKVNKKKHFVFDCYGLPDSIQELCNDLNFYNSDSSISMRPINTEVNTDSIVETSYLILEKNFINLRPKSPQLIFAPPQ